MIVDPREPLELIIRPERIEKTHEQRKLFHAVCSDIAPHRHEEPRVTKLKVKAAFYGVEVVLKEDGVIVAVVPSSEDSDREEYSRLIDFAYQWAAEQGIYVPDRRMR